MISPGFPVQKVEFVPSHALLCRDFVSDYFSLKICAFFHSSRNWKISFIGLGRQLLKTWIALSVE